MILEHQAPAEQHPLRLAELPDPEPLEHEVLIEIGCCGVCRTDLHIVEGELPLRQRPTVPGHQIIGRVQACGSRVSSHRVGDRVGCAWLHHTCGHCTFCQSDRENLCTAADFTGWSVPGGFAQRVTVPESFAYPVPGAFDEVHAAPLLCAGIIGYRALRRCGIQPHQRLALYGFGAAAHLAIQVAHHWKCETVVYTRSRESRDLARTLGAVWSGGVEDPAPGASDAAVIFAPAGSLVLHALEHLRKGGTVSLAGIHMSPIPQMDYATHLYDEKVLCSTANATRRDAEEFLALAGEIPLQTHTSLFPLEQANQALCAVKHSKVTGAVVLQIA